ncbi:MAG: phospholipid carrier-dependent glycosyltransferase [Oscillospiraceae bacterium]|nr:phospholipid carrier-dependent glycosyltransferase [Oscillospiraceae bacterium]
MGRLAWAAALSVALSCVFIANASAAGAGPTGPEPANLFADPGFEGADLSAWKVYDYESDYEGNPRAARVSLDAETYMSGTQSVRIEVWDDDDVRVMQTVAVEPESFYLISCWVRLSGVGQGRAGVNISSERGLQRSKGFVGTNGEWRPLSVYGRTDKGQTSATITIGLGGYGSVNVGTCWIDDASMVKVDSVPDGADVIDIFVADGKEVMVTTALDRVMSVIGICASLAVLTLAFVMARKGHGRPKEAMEARARRLADGTSVDDEAVKSTEDGAEAGDGDGIGPPAEVEVAGSAAPEAAHAPASVDASVAAAESGGPEAGTRPERIEAKPKRRGRGDADGSRMTRTDCALMLALTAVYAFIALFNLGGHSSPTSFWKSTSVTDSFVVDFGEVTEVTRFLYHVGIMRGSERDGTYRLEYRDVETGRYEHLAQIDKKSFFKWGIIDLEVTTDRIKVTTPKRGLALNEIGFFGGGDKERPLPIVITDIRVVDSAFGTPLRLIDEQGTLVYDPTYMHHTYFDEVYFPRTAYEHLNRLPIYEVTHPPLGKVIMASGIAAFGMNPFGWRIMGTLFGIMMTPLMYLFGKKLFKGTFLAFCVCFIFTFDFMHFTQTRLATIDSYSVFFIILMYYFMFDYYVRRPQDLGLRRSLTPLLLSGLAFGLGAASKWIVLYGAGGLVFIYFLTMYLNARDYREVRREAPETPWLRRFLAKHVFAASGMSVIFFIVIPAVIYALSYIPYAMVEGEARGLAEIVVENQKYMFGYHANLTATHSYGSMWYTWPAMVRPIWYYSGPRVGDLRSSIVAFGNPLVWWVGFAAFIVAVYVAYRKRDKVMAFVFAAMVFQYLPWMVVTRVVFIYHFFSFVPFMAICIVYLIKCLMERFPGVRPRHVAVYLALVLLAFAVYYPVLSGMYVPGGYIEALKLLPSWSF